MPTNGCAIAFGPRSTTHSGRHGIEIPYPIQVQISQQGRRPAAARTTPERRAYARAGVNFCIAQRTTSTRQLAERRREACTAAARVSSNRAMPGSSMFVVVQRRGGRDARAGRSGDRAHWPGRILRRDVAPDRRAAECHGADGGGFGAARNYRRRVSASSCWRIRRSSNRSASRSRIGVRNSKSGGASGAAAAHSEPPHTLIDRIRRYLHLIGHGSRFQATAVKADDTEG